MTTFWFGGEQSQALLQGINPVLDLLGCVIGKVLALPLFQQTVERGRDAHVSALKGFDPFDSFW